MKFLDLNGLKHLLKKIVKYDNGTSDISNINALSVNKIKTTYVQNKNTSGTAPAYIIFPDPSTIGFKAGDIRIDINPTDGLVLKADPVLEDLFPEEIATIEQQGLFLTLASILYDLKDKGIIS